MLSDQGDHPHPIKMGNIATDISSRGSQFLWGWGGITILGVKRTIQPFQTRFGVQAFHHIWVENYKVHPIKT